jgi:hypothetical protein
MHSPPAEHQRDADAEPAPSTEPKNAALAVALNCLVPGLGLAYLGRWWMALANLLVGSALVFGPYFAHDPTIIEHIHWVVMVVVVGSGALAHGVAKSPS